MDETVSGRQPASRAMRNLGWFWGAVIVAVAAGGGVLQYLGPPRPAMMAAVAPAMMPKPASTAFVTTGSRPASEVPVIARRPARDTTGAEVQKSEVHAPEVQKPEMQKPEVQTPEVTPMAPVTQPPTDAVAMTPDPMMDAAPKTTEAMGADAMPADKAPAMADAARPVPPPETAGMATADAAPLAPGALPAALPALLEPSATFAGGQLPRISADGRMPMRVYAARVAPADARPRVALLLSGIGMSETDSEEAIHTTPAAVSLAVSPYAFRPERLLADARAAGHETLLSLPLEPDRYPIDDPGNRAMLTGNPTALNQQRLEWALTRFAGYVGATGALNGLRGERFAAAHDSMTPLLHELAGRGLLYIDPRPGAPHPPFATGHSVDVVIDEPAVRTEIEANLARLEQVARDRGAALGLVGTPRPVALGRIAAWAATLAARGITLVPVSAIADPPPMGTKQAAQTAE